MLTGPEEMHEQQFAVKKEKEFNIELAHQEYRELIPDSPMACRVQIT